MKLRITILKYHSWYLCQISLQIMLLPIQIQTQVVLFQSDISQQPPWAEGSVVINFSRKGGRRGEGSYEEADCNIISILFSSERVQHFLF